MTSAALLPQQAVDDARRKRIATLTARLALKSHQLVELPDGTFMVGRWGWPPRALADLDAVRAFAELRIVSMPDRETVSSVERDLTERITRSVQVERDAEAA